MDEDDDIVSMTMSPLVSLPGSIARPLRVQSDDESDEVMRHLRSQSLSMFSSVIPEPKHGGVKIDPPKRNHVSSEQDAANFFGDSNLVTIDVLTEMKQGMTCEKYGKTGKAHRRIIKLADDHNSLVFFSAKKMHDTRVYIRDIQALHVAQDAEFAVRILKQRSLIKRAFSVVYLKHGEERRLNLVVKPKPGTTTQPFAVWTAGLKELLAQHDKGVDLSTLERLGCYVPVSRLTMVFPTGMEPFNNKKLLELQANLKAMKVETEMLAALSTLRQCFKDGKAKNQCEEALNIALAELTALARTTKALQPPRDSGLLPRPAFQRANTNRW
jgi:transposase-like protein